MLTDLQIEKLTVPTKRREVPDGKLGGLYLVLQPSGAKSWALRYRVAGVPKKFTIGPYPAISLAAARKRAQKALAEVVDGNDPSAQKKAARNAAKAANSTADRIENVVEAFVKKHLAPKTKPSWAHEAERLLRVEIVAKWGKRRLGDVTAKDVDKLLGEIAERAPITANRTLAVFRKLCNWAATPKIGLLAASPCVGIEAPSAEHSRERVLSDDEIGLAWRAFEKVGQPFGAIAKLLLLTGARRDEVAAMRWSEIDVSEKMWRLPPPRTKNKRAHEVPLTDAVVAILKAAPRIGDGKDKDGFVFTTTGKTSVSGFSRAKATIDAAIVELLKEQAEQRGEDAKEVKAAGAMDAA